MSTTAATKSNKIIQLVHKWIISNKGPGLKYSTFLKELLYDAISFPSTDASNASGLGKNPFFFETCGFCFSAILSLMLIY